MLLDGLPLPHYNPTSSEISVNLCVHYACIGEKNEHSSSRSAISQSTVCPNFWRQSEFAHAAWSPLCYLDLHGCPSRSRQIRGSRRRRCPRDPQRGWTRQ